MTRIRYHSQIGTTAYLDLLRLLQDRQVAAIKGSPVQVTVNDRQYWYDKYRVGNEMAQRYIGPHTPELQQRLDDIEQLKTDAKEREREQARLVRILRAEGYNSTDQKTGSLLHAFAKVGVFRLGGTLIGTVAFRRYEGELGVRLGFDQLAQTGDIDIGSFERLSFAIGDTVEEDLANVFRDLKFRPVPSLTGTQTWRWMQANGAAYVEFLMPATGTEGVRELPTLGVSARALRHLDFLLADPIPAAMLYRSGVLIQIPRPERYAVHKLIVAQRRVGGPDSIKARKDLAQADLLFAVLNELRPIDLRESFIDALDRGPKWRKQIDESLNRLPSAHHIVDTF